MYVVVSNGAVRVEFREVVSGMAEGECRRWLRSVLFELSGGASSGEDDSRAWPAGYVDCTRGDADLLYPGGGSRVGVGGQLCSGGSGGMADGGGFSDGDGESVGAAGDERGRVEDDGGELCGSRVGVHHESPEGVAVSSRTMANRRKRVNRKIRKCEQRLAEKKGVGVVPEWRRKEEKVEKPSSVPEWRAKSSDTVVGHSPGHKSQVPEGDELKRTLREKWIMKNRLETEEARRKLEVLKANDVEEEARRYRTRVKKHTESNMVKIEKTHAFLKATGNVPGQMPVQVSEVDAGGRIKTVLSGETISPDSSASQHEVRQMQKDLADALAENERLRRGIESVKLDPELIDVYNKSEWTVGSDDFPTDKNEKLLEKLYPDGYDRFGDVLKDEAGARRARYVPGF